MDWLSWSKKWGVPDTGAEKLAHQLRTALSREFNLHLSLSDLMHPAQAGQVLLGKSGVDLTPLPSDVQALITNTSCQHRIELYPGRREIQRLYCFDGRAMYLGCCRGLGIAGGKYRHEEGGALEVLPEDRGRAEVEFRAPKGWSHVGLLGCKNPKGEGWVWPIGGRTWADVSEVRWAIQHGWKVQVLQKIVWPEGRPLDLWAEKLSRIYLRARKEEGNETDRSPGLGDCVRNVALQCIGSLHNLGYRDESIEVSDGDPRASLENIRGITDTGVVITQRRATNKDPYFIHPEWSAAIWSRVHLRVSRCLLSMPREQAVAVYGDAIYTSGPPPLRDGSHSKGGPWFDDGTTGRFRLKSVSETPVCWPKSWGEIKSICRHSQRMKGCS